MVKGQRQMRGEQMTEQHIDECNIPGQQFGERTVGVQDDLGKELIEEQKKRVTAEIESYKNQIELKEKLLARHKEQWNTEKARWEIMLEGYTRITPEWKFELNPKYDELSKKIHTYNFEMQKEQAENWQTQTAQEIELLKERIVKQTEELDKIIAGEKNE